MLPNLIHLDLVRPMQRDRLLTGMLTAAAELGYREASVEDVLERAGLSRPTFYEHFENKEDCFLQAFDAAAERLWTRLVVAASESDESWRDRLRLGLEELLRWVAEEPEAARALIVESRSAGPAGLLRRDAVLDRFTACIDSWVREEATAPSALAAAGIVGGIEALLYARIAKGEAEDLDPLLPSLMYFAVLPLEGHEVANGELGAAAVGQP
jgi:AcrR family transcriptional regulator